MLVSIQYPKDWTVGESNYASNLSKTFSIFRLCTMNIKQNNRLVYIIKLYVEKNKIKNYYYVYLQALYGFYLGISFNLQILVFLFILFDQFMNNFFGNIPIFQEDPPVPIILQILFFISSVFHSLLFLLLLHSPILNIFTWL